MLRLKRFGLTLLAGTLVTWLGCATSPAQTNSTAPPQYGGTLNVGSIHVAMSALSWPPGDLDWNVDHETSAVYQDLFAADLSKMPRNDSEGSTLPGYLAPEFLRGELAESWEWEQNPLRIVVKLRKGVMFPDKPGIMRSRELVAGDVVYAFNRLTVPKKIAKYGDHFEKVEAIGPYTVVFTFKPFDAPWVARLGWGYSSPIYPKEVFDAGMGDWRHANGSGPFMLSDVEKDATTYTKNPTYWETQAVGGTDYRMPFLDKIVYRSTKVAATWIASLRIGKLDLPEGIAWENVDDLKRDAPQLQWQRWLATDGTFLAMRTDVDGPLRDIRVRRALNMAVNKQKIVSAYYRGNAALFAYPEHPNFGGYFEPLEAMPESVQELFSFNPDKARQLLAEAGYSRGFTFKTIVCSCNTDHMNVLSLIADYLKQIGVNVEIQTIDESSFQIAVTSHTMSASYFMNAAHSNPLTSLRDNFTTGQQRNVSGWSDPVFDQRMDDAFEESDEVKRQAVVHELTRTILDKAPYLWLPTPYAYTAWWPWVRNYIGELPSSVVRPGAIYAGIWIDQKMKKAMGF